MLVADDADARDPALYPDRWPQGDLDLPLTYAYDPGTEHDGVTVHIPIQVLDRVVPDGFDRLVPGMQAELAVATIRALPKPVRVQLVPAPDVAAAVVGWLAGQPSWADTVRAGDAAPSWHTTFAQAVRELRGVEIPADAFDDSRLPAHLRMTFRVVEDRRGGRGEPWWSTRGTTWSRSSAGWRRSPSGPCARRCATHCAGRWPSGTTCALPRRPEPRRGGPAPAAARGAAPAPRPGARPGHDLERTGLTTWPDLTTIPDRVRPRLVACTSRASRRWSPAPKPERPAPVDLRVLSRPDARRHAVGVRELLLGELVLAPGRITSRWNAGLSLALGASPYPSTPALVLDLQRAALDAMLAERLGPADTVRDRERYEALRTELRDALEDRVHAVAVDAAAVLVAARELDADLRATTSLALLSVVHELRGWADSLVADGFVSRAGAARLPHLVRYLRAARHRLAKAAENLGRDEGLAWQVHELVEGYGAARRGRRGPHPGPRARRASGRDPLAARGAAGLAVRPAARHAAAGLGQADPHALALTRV